MKRILAVVGVLLIGIALVWRPWSQIDLQSATVVLPAARSTPAQAGIDDVLTIIFSGDGGWADLDKKLGGELVAQGLPVLGISTFQYYWHARTADESAAQLDALISQYLAAWGKRRVWLIGFSFGADVLPSIVVKMSPENRAAIAQLVLLSPGRDLTFEIEVQGYMSQQGWFPEHLKSFLQQINPVMHYPGIPPLNALDGRPAVACYYGADDYTTSLCTAPGAAASMQVHEKSGGHHFDGDYPLLAKQLIDDLRAKKSVRP